MVNLALTSQALFDVGCLGGGFNYLLFAPLPIGK